MASRPPALEASVAHARSASPEELVGIARALWERVRARLEGVPAGDPAEARALAEAREAEPDFAASFPIVVRWMVEARTFRAAAFRRFLSHRMRCEPADNAEFLRVQAEYLVELFAGARPRPSEDAVRRYRAEVNRRLEDEEREFRRAAAEAEAILAARAREAATARRAAVHALLASRRAAGPA